MYLTAGQYKGIKIDVMFIFDNVMNMVIRYKK